MRWPESVFIYVDGYFERNVGYRAQHDATWCNVTWSGVRLMFNFSLHCKPYSTTNCAMILFRIEINRFFFYSTVQIDFVGLLIFIYNDLIQLIQFFIFRSNRRFFMDEKMWVTSSKLIGCYWEFSAPELGHWTTQNLCMYGKLQLEMDFILPNSIKSWVKVKMKSRKMFLNPNPRSWNLPIVY